MSIGCGQTQYTDSEILDMIESFLANHFRIAAPVDNDAGSPELLRHISDLVELRQGGIPSSPATRIPQSLCGVRGTASR